MLERVLPRARAWTALPLLRRLDSGHEALETRVFGVAEDVDFILKGNPRQASPERGLGYAEAAGPGVLGEYPRPGKRVGTFSVYLAQPDRNPTDTFGRVRRVTERTRDGQGPRLRVPEVEGWWNSLELADAQGSRRYEEHAPSEPFHAEVKTELDIERLPAGKFATHELVLGMAALGYPRCATSGASVLSARRRRCALPPRVGACTR